LKRKKKKEFTSPPRFRPGSPTLPRGVLAPARATRSPRSAWVEPSKCCRPSSRDAAPSFSVSVIDNMAPRVRPPSSFPRRRLRFPSVVATESNPFSNLPFPFLEPPLGYKTESPHPSTPSHLDVKHRNRPKEAPLGSPLWPSAIPSCMPPFGPSLALFLLEVSSSCSVLLPRVFISLNHAWNRVIVISGDGAAANIAVGVVFPAEAPPAHPNSIWSVHLISNGRRLKILFWLYILLKRPCVFQLSNP
jgi:hypothetical protein